MTERALKPIYEWVAVKADGSTFGTTRSRSRVAMLKRAAERYGWTIERKQIGFRLAIHELGLAPEDEALLVEGKS